MAFSWGGALRGVSNLFSRGRGGGSTFTSPNSRVSGTVGVGGSEYYDPFRRGGTYIQPRQDTFLDKAMPWAQLLGAGFEGLWGSEAQKAKLAREQWEQKVKWEEEDRKSNRLRTKMALNAINRKWGGG